MQSSVLRLNTVDKCAHRRNGEKLLRQKTRLDFFGHRKKFDCKLSPNIEQEYRKRVSELFDSHLEAFEGVHQALDEISVPICIATSAPLKKVKPALQKTNLSKYFKTNIFSSYVIGSWKPEPDIFLYAAEFMEVAPQNRLVVEDSVAGIEAANAAGMSSVQFCGSSQPFHSNFIHSYDELGRWISTL